MPTSRTLSRFPATIDEIPENTRLALYGAGETGESIKKRLNRMRLDVKVPMFIDSFKSGTCSDIPIVNFDNLKNHLSRFDTILITSMFWNQIETNLQIAGLDNYLIASNRMIYDSCPLRNHGPFGWSDDEYIHCQGQIDRVNTLLEREIDREIYSALVQLRRPNDTKGIEFLKNFDYRTEHYIDNIDFETISCIIEGGVFDGADTAKFNSLMKNLGHIYGFDPFIQMYENGPHYNELYGRSNIEINPHAIWDKNEILQFNSGNEVPSGSSITTASGQPEKSIEVEAVRIDDFITDRGIEKVDLIKMDIEGAELEALMGARQTIATHQPYLAISIYHKKQHLYEIPLFLNNVLPEYRFRIGQYSPTFVDTVLYAIPPGIAR